MAEYYAVLSRAITGLTNASPETRRAVYDKARNALISQLKAIVPALPTSEISRQRLELEEAIRRVERELQSGTMPAAPAPAQIAPRPPQVPPVPVPSVAAPPPQPVARQGAPIEPARPAETEGRSPQEIFRQAIINAEGRGGVPGDRVQPRQGPVDRATPAPPVARNLRPAPPEAPGNEPHMGEVRGLVPEMPPPPPPRRGRGYQPPPVPSEPQLAPDYGYETEPEETPRSAMERGREMRLGPAPIDPEIDDVAPTRRGWGRRGNVPAAEGEPQPARRRRSSAPTLLLFLILVLAGGIGAFAWTQRATIANIVSLFDKPGTAPTPAPAPKPPTVAPPPGLVVDDPASNKNGDRLLPPGQNPAPGQNPVRQVGPGTPGPAAAPAPSGSSSGLALAPPSSVPVVPTPVPPQLPQASLNPPSGQPVQAPALVPTGAQKATLFEEPTDPALAATKTFAFAGNVAWTYAPTGPDGPALIGTVTIPDRKMTVTITIHRNTKADLPASHLVELQVTTQPDFPGKGIQSVPTIVLKPSEDGRGDVLVGAAATVASGYYWVALSNAQKDQTTNLGLLKDRAWIDIRLVYASGQRAILSLEKGTSGAQAFAKALTAWQAG